MSKLFHGLVSEGVLGTWAELLDWLFDDNRFSVENGWTSGYVGAFIKKVKRIPNLGNHNYQYGPIKDLNIPQTTPDGLTIIHAKGDGESRDLVRHIRNGIAHGKTELSKPNGELHIKILDFNNQGEQTAYIWMSITQLQLIYKAYAEVKKSKENARKRGR